MCGIAGLVAPGSVDSLASRVRLATNQLAHRGPDGSGIFSQAAGMSDGSLSRDSRHVQLAPSGPLSSAVCVGHSRLRIIDLTDAGAQPFPSADGRFVLAFNGAIYNYRELRHELGQLGAEFRSNSDTEVLLAAWERWAEGCLSRLVGMFAFAVLDRARLAVSPAQRSCGAPRLPRPSTRSPPWRACRAPLRSSLAAARGRRSA